MQKRLDAARRAPFSVCQKTSEVAVAHRKRAKRPFFFSRNAAYSPTHHPGTERRFLLIRRFSAPCCPIAARARP